MCIVGDRSDSRPDHFEVLNQTFVFTGSSDSFMQAGDTLAVHSLFWWVQSQLGVVCTMKS